MESPAMELTLEEHDDYSHRIHNDENYAISRAGLKTTQYGSMLFLNLEHGSYNTGGNFKLLREHCSLLHEELRGQPNHPQLRLYWNGILKDRDLQFETGDAAVGVAARAAYCESFKLNKCFTTVTETTALATWRTW